MLGHTIESSGSIRPCWTKCRTSMWRAFWANPASTSARDLSTPQKLALTNRVVLPQLSCRCSRWPPQRQVAFELDHVQQKMTSSLLRLPRVMMERKLRALFVDAVEQHANAMKIWGFGLSTGLQEPSVGTIICLDPSITTHGLRSCESTEAKSG